MKTTMIVTGGLSGGISAAIAGGNFWDGFKQGIISAGLNHVAHVGAAALDGDENYKALNKEFRRLVKSKDYKGVIDLANKTYSLNLEVEDLVGGYIITDPKGFSGGMVTHGFDYEGFSIYIIEITKSAFSNSLATFVRALSHEYQHVLIFEHPILSEMSRNVRETLAYYKQIFNNKLPVAPYYEMEGYYRSAKKYVNDLTTSESNLLKPIYGAFMNSNLFNFKED